MIDSLEVPAVTFIISTFIAADHLCEIIVALVPCETSALIYPTFHLEVECNAVTVDAIRSYILSIVITTEFVVAY
jgi:hypothetical protein